MRKLLLLLCLIPAIAQAKFMVDTTVGFLSTTDSKTSNDTSDQVGSLYIGASIGTKERFYIGQNITSFTHQIKSTTTDKISTLELGPQLTYFFSDENVFYVMFGWNPYAKGTRTVSNTSEDISGYSLVSGLGAELRINRGFHIGTSLNYRSLSITKSISSTNVASTVSDTYSSIMPMINFSLRFR